eukprot:3178523-Rhodomonas_salina.1
MSSRSAIKQRHRSVQQLSQKEKADPCIASACVICAALDLFLWVVICGSVLTAGPWAGEAEQVGEFH